MEIDLIRKYNVQAPRYTSYPTVPYWDEIKPSVADWQKVVQLSYSDFDKDKGISLYIHLPYCESLCTYCGCNTRITVNHAVEKPYVDALLREWSMYLDIFPDRPKIKEIHLGGGTPTFFSAHELERMIKGILAGAVISEEPELSFEAHPSNTTEEHLKTLFDLGFRRLSLGVQDFDLKVQEVINRRQTEEQVLWVTQKAREIGYTSVNYDLIYGLPFQTLDTVKKTISTVIEHKPDRIAFYAYAHVPWIKPGQRKYSDADLPRSEEKLALYNTGREMLEDAGYKDVGMDHFALEHDSLHKAYVSGNLHRNFMGYTTTSSRLLIGLGVSSISDAWFGFVQNKKVVEEYMEAVNAGELPFFKGHLLNDEDLFIRRMILNLMCRYETSWDEESAPDSWFNGLGRLDEMISDGLAFVKGNTIQITEKGKPFLRNVCMAFDARLHSRQPGQQVFSSAI